MRRTLGIAALTLLALAIGGLGAQEASETAPLSSTTSQSSKSRTEPATSTTSPTVAHQAAVTTEARMKWFAPRVATI
ncbi:hypothetical protein [Streptomyces axinellae]|uniref:Uncharacterized protein n=1 Tax=Streptomyces axinellae TaxID=552788 RepID=A0ABN3Q911_9ACTN